MKDKRTGSVERRGISPTFALLLILILRIQSSIEEIMPRQSPACWSIPELEQCAKVHDAEEKLPLGQISYANTRSLFVFKYTEQK